MLEIATLVLPNSYASGVATILDSHALTMARGGRIIGTAAAAAARLSVLSLDGADIMLSNRLPLRVDRAATSKDIVDFLWLPAFDVDGTEQMRAQLDAASPLFPWFRRLIAKGALIGASGNAVMLPLAAGLTTQLDVPVSPTLLPIVRAIFPGARYTPAPALIRRGGLHLASGAALDLDIMSAVFEQLFSPYAANWLRAFAGASPLDSDPPGSDTLVMAAKHYLEQRFNAPISIAALASELCVTHASLLRRFRRETGATPSAYLRDLRLKTAKRLLKRTSLPVERIANMVGYSDARLFRTMFRQMTSMTASQWRGTMSA